MRFYVVFAAAIFLVTWINCVSATADLEETKLVITADTATSTRSLTVGNDGADKRFLRSHKTTEDADPEDEERAVNVKFWLWKKIGRTPGSVYEKYFNGMTADKILDSPKYKVWQNFEKWFNKPKKAATTTA